MSEIKTVYSEIEIVYSEREDKWVFELRGRERKTDTLSKAKEAIDKPDPKEKDKKPFERVQAYKVSNWDTFTPVEVTSIADSNGHSRDVYVWVVADGKRQKEDASNLVLISDDNKAKVQEWKDRQKEIERLTTLNRALISGMERIKVS